MSPRTSTWTEILGSFADTDVIAFGRECLMYRLGSIRRKTDNVVEANTASVKRRSNIVTWLQVWLSGQPKGRTGFRIMSRLPVMALNPFRRTDLG